MLLLLLLVGLAPSFQAAPDSDPKALLFYVDSAPAPSRPKPLALLSLQPPPQVLDKQVAEQQVLYEFQQTPTNSVSNVHVKQLFQPPGAPERAQLVAQGTQVLPKQTPFVYLTGRPVRNQSPIVPEDRVNPGSVYHQRVYHNQQKIPLLSYGQRAQQAPRNTFFASAPLAAPQLPPISRNVGFQPPNRLQQIDRPSPSAQPSDEEEDEEVEDPENLEEDEDDDNKDDNSEPEADEEPEAEQEDDEEEEEEDKESSDEVPEHFFSPRSKFRKFRYESDKDDGEDTDESKQSAKYQQPPQKTKKIKRAGQGPEGGYSHQVPVTHKQKIYKERWYLSKDLEGAASQRLH